MWHVTCDTSYFKCLCWSLGHAEQLLFSGLCSKVSISNYVTCDMSHFACHIVHVICQMLMLILRTCWTTFVFMWKLKSEYLWTCHMSHVACHMSHVLCQMLMLILGTCWTIFVFMSMLKCRCLWVKMSMCFFFDSHTLPCDNTNHRAGSQLKTCFQEGCF